MSISLNTGAKVLPAFPERRHGLLTETKNFIAHLLSSVLIPLLIPVYLCGILLFYYPSLVNVHAGAEKWALFLEVLGITVILPFVLVFALFKLKIISSLTLYKRSDRFIPQLFSCVLYLLLCLHLAFKMGVTNAVSLAMIANTVSLLVITVITRFWKISTHAAGAIGFLSIVGMIYFKHPVPNFQVLFLAIVVSSVAVCLARLYLKAHTLGQVIAGGALGLVIGIAVFSLLP